MDLLKQECFCASAPSTMAEPNAPSVRRREAAKAQAPRPPPEVLPAGDPSVWQEDACTKASTIRQDVWHLLGRD